MTSSQQAINSMFGNLSLASNFTNSSSLFSKVTNSTGIQLTNLDFDGNGAEMGFFFGLSLLSVFFLLDKLNGSIFRMKIYLMNRDFHLIQNQYVITGLTYFIRMMSWLAITLPFLALGVWTAGLIIRSSSLAGKPATGITVALVGSALFFFLLNFFHLKWNFYKFDIRNFVYFVLTFLLLTAYQFVAIFLSEKITAFGIQAIFLSANCLLMMLIVFIQSAVKNGSIEDLIKAKIAQGSTERDSKRQVDFEEEIQREKDQKDYFPTTDDLNDIFTIAKPQFNAKWESPAYSSGLQNFIGNIDPNLKRVITVVLWILATGILVAYALVIGKYFPQTSNLGWIVMVAILTTDILVYLIQNAEIVKTATPLACTLFLNRFFLIVFGESNWVYGYIIIFICYGVLLSSIIAIKRFPLEDEVKNYDLDDIAARMKAIKEGKHPDEVSLTVKGPAGQALNQIGNLHQKVSENISFLKVPEYPFLIITIIYLIIFIVLTGVKPKTIPLPKILIHSREVHFFVAWALSLVLILAYFTSIAVIRLFIRRKMGVSQRVYFELKNMCASKMIRIDRYWFFMVFNLITLIGIGIISWWLTKSWSACILIVFIDLYVLSIMNFYTYLLANDFEILQNIENVNMRANQHNMRQDNLKKEIENVKKQILEGGAQGVGNQSVIERAMTMVKQAEEKKPIVPGGLEQNNKQTGDQWAGEVNPTKPTPIIQKKEDPPAPKIPDQPKPEPQPFVQPLPPKPQPKPVDPPKVDVKIQPQMKDEDLVDEEINRMNDKAREKGRKNKQANDGIYEGGEAEELKKNEITELLVDPDEEEKVDERTTRIRYKNVEDWRKETNFFNAFWTGRLRKNDYQIIISQILSLIVMVIGAWLVCHETKSYVGITIFVPIAHYSLAAYSHMRTLSTDSPMHWFEYVCFFLAYLIQYGWSIWNLYLTYGFWNKNISKIMKPTAGLYIVVNLIMIPFITSCVVAILKWIDTKGKFTPFFIVQLVITGLQGIGMLVCAFIYMTWVQGVIVTCVVCVLGYVVLQVIIYLKNDNYMPRLWVFINVGIVICAIVASFVASFFAGELSIFMGFSISTWLLSFLLLVFGIGRIAFDLRSQRTRPIFFSPWVFPIYSYDPKKQDVSSQNLPAACVLGALVLLEFWSVLATAWFTPAHAGVALSILFEQLLIIAIMYMVQISHMQLHKLQNYIDRKTVRRAWLEAKAKYVANRNAFNRDELVTFEELFQRKNLLRNKMRISEGRQSLSIEEKFEGVQLIPQVSDAEIDSWLNKNLVDMTQPISQYSYLFEIENDLERTYRQELELIIMFELLVIAYTEIYYDQKKKYIFNFLIERRPVLLAVDIVINIPPNSKPNIQYAKVIAQIQQLPQDKFEMFNDLRETFIQEMRQIDDMHKEAAMKEQEAVNEREKRMAEIQQRRRDGVKTNDQSKPVEQWVDCLEKWEKIKEQCKSSGKKFTDTDFKADKSSLGNSVAQCNPDIAWIRAIDQVQDQRCVLYKDQVNALDVIQGSLGDCYFLSAISVLGQQNVEAMLKATEEDWKTTGAFCVRFYRDGHEEYVIIDDFFPAKISNNRYEWAFCKGGDLGIELWPMVLEKAYAKLFGSYEFIEAGKVHYALADMIEGFPQQIDLRADAKNVEVFWEKIKIFKRQGALMGAGSPENPMGDSAINQQGIVQGHAYALLDVQEVDSYKLIKLRNPHGKNGAEWKGDWSDSSTNWNQRMKNKLEYEPKDHEDGIFWMDCDDFVQQFSYLYVCRILNQSIGWYKQSLDSAWKGKSAEGLPNRANPSAKLELNPQFGITITKPCDGFILLKQKDGDPTNASTFKGKLSIFFMISKNNGKRIKKVEADLIVTRSGNPTNLMIISKECEFDRSVSYPYTFSLLAANTGQGSSGEGEFEVVVYSTDPDMKMTPLPEA